MAMSGLRQVEFADVFRNVTVVDFNCDRVLLTYLFRALQTDYGLNYEATTKCLANLKVPKPRGSLGNLDWQSNREILDFGSGEQQLTHVAERLRTYTEDKKSISKAEIKAALTEAQVVLVLGVGFHPQNIELLRVIGAPAEKRVFMTTYGMAKSDRS